MPERIHIICHAKAGGTRGAKVLNDVQEILSDYNLEYLTYYTSYATHAHLLTENIAKKLFNLKKERLLVIGGDGTLHEVVNTLCRLNSRIPVTYVAAGTGNDFARAWQHKRSIRQTIEIMMFADEPTDIPITRYEDTSTQSKGIIVNNLGFGFDAEVNHNANQFPLKKTFQKLGIGNLIYILSVFSSLNKIKAYDAELTVDNHRLERNDNAILSIMNHPYAGGGIQIDPAADPHKKEVSLIAFHNITFRAAIDLIFRVLITKNQLKSKYVTRYTGQTMQLKIDQPIRTQIDGEDLGERKAQLTFGVGHYPFYL